MHVEHTFNRLGPFELFQYKGTHLSNKAPRLIERLENIFSQLWIIYSRNK